MRKTRNERGQVWVTFIGCLSVLAIVLAIVTELSPAFSAKAAQRGYLDAVECELGLPSSVLLDGQGTTPSGPDTAHSVARRAVECCRDAGFAGVVRVWFYEPTEGTGRVDANDRLWAWQVSLSETCPTRLSGFTGTDGIHVESSTAGTANPYARERVFRSATSQAGQAACYVSESGSALVRDASVGSIDDMPEGLREAFGRSMDGLRAS